MTTHFRTTHNPFMAAREAALRDPRLSFTAKGLYSYLFTHTQDATLDIQDINRFHIADRDSVQMALSELVNQGYLLKQTSGDYSLIDADVDVNPRGVVYE